MLQIDFQPFAATITFQGSQSINISLAEEILTIFMQAFTDYLDKATKKLIIGHIKAIIETDQGYVKASLTEVKGQIRFISDTYDHKEDCKSQITLNSVISGADKDIENKALDQAIQKISDDYHLTVDVHHEHHHDHYHDHGEHHHH